MAGRPRIIAPDEPTVRVSAEVPVTVAEQLRTEAEAAGRSVASIIRERLNARAGAA